MLLFWYAASGCGDNVSPACTATEFVVSEDPSCLAAVEFAARDTSALVPTQEEIDRYHDRWRRVLEAEPLLLAQLPQVYRIPGPGAFDVYTTNRMVIAAWHDNLTWATREPQRAPLTGDSGFDAILADLDEPQLNAPLNSDLGDGLFFFSAFNKSIFNEEIMQARLLSTDSHLYDARVQPREDGQWRWIGAQGSGTDDATADIVFKMGWGDCFSGCEGFRQLEAIASPAEVTVYDLGGDPLPPYLHFSPYTRPKP